MQQIQIVAYGKLKERYLRDACAEYEKRLSRFCKFQCVELEPIALPEKPSEKAILTSRMVDRPIRPLFPKDMRNDVSVVMTVLAVDPD